jgi:rubrerythrin
MYGTLATWARQLGLQDDARVLHAILEEEERADEKLSHLAEQGINREAAGQDFGNRTRSRRTASYGETGGYLHAGRRAVEHRMEDQPLLASLLVGAAGYFLAYLVHGSHGSWTSGRPEREDYEQEYRPAMRAPQYAASTRRETVARH